MKRQFKKRCNENRSPLFIIKENHVLCAWSNKALSDGEKKPPMI